MFGARAYKTLFLVLATFSVAPFLGSHAEQNRDSSIVGGLFTDVRLNHRVVIPQIIYFRLGAEAPGDIDKISFKVSPGGVGNGNNQTYSTGGAIPIGDGTPVSAGTSGTLPVVIAANVGTLNLSYDLSDPQGLQSAAGDYIPFDEITVVSADPGGLPTPALANAGSGGAISVPITGNLFSGRVIQRRTTWTYTYDNNQVVAAGTYSGRVRYTLSAP